jgi:hypothetical protein
MHAGDAAAEAPWTRNAILAIAVVNGAPRLMKMGTIACFAVAR